MLNLDITRLAAVWEKAPLKINPAQCLPLCSPKSGCRLCVRKMDVPSLSFRACVYIAEDYAEGFDYSFDRMVDISIRYDVVFYYILSVGTNLHVEA